MADKEPNTAVVLMRMALALLNRDGETLAAARLENAIDTVLRSAVGVAPTEEEIDALFS